MKQVFPAIPDRLKKLGVEDSDWFIACKDGLRWLMRPGMPLKVRVSICLILYSQGYNNELAMVRVQSQAENDSALFVALAPFAIITILQKAAIEEFRKSGVELDDAQRKKLRISGPNMRAALGDLEQEDRTVTRVRANCDPKKLIGLTFDEAMERSLVTPIENLTPLERKKLNQRSFIYVHTHPRPATKTALTRRVDDDLLNPAGPKEDGKLKMMEGPQQMAFRYLKAFGLTDAKFAAKVAKENDYQEAYAEVTTGRTAMQKGIDRLKQLMARKAKEEITRRQMDLFPEEVAEAAPPADPPLVSRPRPRALTAEELSPVNAAIRLVCSPTTRDVSHLFGLCRDFAPDCTPKEVALFIERKIALKKGKPVDTWYGYLVTAVPPCFEAPDFEKWRVEQRGFDELEAARQAKAKGFDERQARQTAQSILSSDDPAWSEEDRTWARQVLAVSEVA